MATAFRGDAERIVPGPNEPDGPDEPSPPAGTPHNIHGRGTTEGTPAPQPRRETDEAARPGSRPALRATRPPATALMRERKEMEGKGREGKGRSPSDPAVVPRRAARGVRGAGNRRLPCTGIRHPLPSRRPCARPREGCGPRAGSPGRGAPHSRSSHALNLRAAGVALRSDGATR